MLAMVINANAQITTAENGLNTPASSTVQLGGSLVQPTSIDLGSSWFQFTKGGNSSFSVLNNGNVGIGTYTPGARLSFINCDQSDDPVGITWYSPGATSYGIHRTAGSWTGPNYQQLRLSWNTGIVLDPGVSYGKSYVDVTGNGLRVTAGNVGIGTTTPGTLLSLGGSVTNSKLAIWEGDYNGQVMRCGLGVASGQFRFFVPLWNNRFSFLADEAGTNELMTIQGTGGVGIGTTDPKTAMLAIEKSNNDGGLTLAPIISLKNTSTTLPAGSGYNTSGINYYSGNGAVLGQCVSNYGIGGGTPWNSGSGFYITTRTDHPIVFATGAATTECMRIGVNGNVGIGTTNISGAGYKLFVEGNIRTRKIQIDQNSWADYVFADNYQLRPIMEVATYIQQNKHLPDVPTADEVKEKGIDVGDNQALLLKKIEELTLYVIQQQKQLEAQQQKIDRLEKKLNNKE